MKRKSWMLLVVLLTVGAAGWAAKPKAKPKPALAYVVSMQAVGTFDAGEPAGKIIALASPDEAEPASFVAKSSKAVSGITVKLAGDLISGKNRLPAAQVTVKAVESNRLVPPVPFDIAPGATRRFWLTFDVPRRTPAGAYAGAVLAVAGGSVVGKLPVELNVLPMRLLRSSKQYGILLPGLAAADGDFLRAIRGSGFGLVSAAVPPDMLGTALACVKQAGLSAPVPYTCPGIAPDELTSLNAQAREAGVSRMLYGSVWEPRTPDEIQAAAEQLQAIRSLKLKSFAVIDDPTAFDVLGASLDSVVCHVNLPYMQGLLSGGKRAGGRNEWWYWDISSGAKENRLYAGLLLWKAGLDGAFPPLASTAEASSQQSVIGTLNWEALREGIDDTRYLTTMMAVLREVKDALKVGGTKNAAIAQKTVDDAETYLSAVLSKPLMDLRNRDYQDIRLKIAQFAIKLQSLKK